MFFLCHLRSVATLLKGGKRSRTEKSRYELIGQVKDPCNYDAGVVD